MFCPNCGKNCGTARFCINCGAQIQPVYRKNEEATQWSVGQPCPCCGGNKLEGIYCAYCGMQLVATKAGAQAEEESAMTDYNSYFHRYRPNRVKAIKALRKDTGMDLVEAKTIIDQVFDENMGQTNSDDLSKAWNNLKRCFVNPGTEKSE